MKGSEADPSVIDAGADNRTIDSDFDAVSNSSNKAVSDISESNCWNCSLSNSGISSLTSTHILLHLSPSSN